VLNDDRMGYRAVRAAQALWDVGVWTEMNVVTQQPRRRRLFGSRSIIASVGVAGSALLLAGYPRTASFYTE
jgi:hypothetical protein